MRTRGTTADGGERRWHGMATLGAIALLTLLLVLWPAQAYSAETPSPVSFNLQAAIDATPSGGTVNVPAGTITISSPVMLKSNITIKGAGVGQTVLYGAGYRDGGAIMGHPTGVSNITISDMTMRSDSPEMDCFGIWLSNHSNVTIERVRMEGMFYALKADTKGSNLTIRDFTVRDSAQIYISRLTKGRFYNLDVETVERRISGRGTMHSIYLEGGSSDLEFYNTRAVGGSGWTVQLYQETTGTSGVLFDGFTVLGRYPVFVGQGFSNITMRNVSATATTTGDPVFWLYGSNKVLVEEFAASGGSRLVTASGSNVVFRNGTYQGTKLGSGATFENVTSSATTVTTRAPTTTTTRAPTTTTQPPTTTAAATTTTTRAPTTTTKPPTTTAQPPTTTAAATTTTEPATTRTAATTTTTTTSPATTNTTAEAAPKTVTTSPQTTTTTLSQIPVSTEVAAVTITSPADGATVQGRVRVHLTVASPIPVAKVRLYVDGSLLAQDYRAPYSFKWNNKSVAPGSVCTLEGVAYDRRGREIGRASCRVTVAAARQLVKAETVAPTAPLSFPDLSSASSYFAAVSTLAEAGAISGFPDGQFGAERATTRAQFAKMASIALGVADEDTIETPFGDLDEIDEYLYPHKFVAALYSIGAVAGTSPNEFSPWRSVTRAQAITILVRALEALDPGALVVPADGSLSALGDIGPDHTRAMTIAEASGLLEGIDSYGSSWNAWAPATRGEVAQILHTLVNLE